MITYAAMVERIIAARSNSKERQERLTRGRQLAADALAVYGQANAQFYVANAERLLALIDAELAKSSR